MQAIFNPLFFFKKVCYNIVAHKTYRAEVIMKKRVLAIILLAVFCSALFACNVGRIGGSTDKGDEDIIEVPVEKPVPLPEPLPETFADAVAKFSLDLFRHAFSSDKNTVISPTSALIALAMVANGAGGNTLSEMLVLLGGSLTQEELNDALFAYVHSFVSDEKTKVKIANSAWFREGGIDVNADFLKLCADIYNAEAKKSAFGGGTVKEINDWVKKNTDGLINKIVEEIPSDAIMYLINAVLFDGKWAEVYNENSITEGVFHAHDGEDVVAKFMHSGEYSYLSDIDTTGFLKPYAGGRYSFATFLPDESISIEDYVKTLSPAKFSALISGAEACKVIASLPKFTAEYEITLNDALYDMGMRDAFLPDIADFTRLGTSYGNIFIGSVMQKAVIEVSEKGTKAAAVTGVIAMPTSVSDSKYVTLDRPFVYAIIDNATGLPLFIGAQLTV